MLYPKKHLKISMTGRLSGERKRLLQSHCLFPIWIGDEPYFQGENLYATLRLINMTFKRCTFVLCDTLQRHRLAAHQDFTWEAAYQNALIAGDLWLQEHESLYRRMRIPVSKMRWDHWLSHKDSAHARRRLEEALEKNAAYRDAFRQSVVACQQRWGLKNKEASEALLQEACAVMLLWAKQSFDFVIYPGHMLGAFQETYTTFIQRFYPNKIVPLELSFSRIESEGLLASQPNPDEAPDEIQLRLIPLEGVLLP